MLRVHAIVPMKNLGQAKSRLSGYISESERRSLVLGLLGNTLSLLCEDSERAAGIARRMAYIQTVWVVSNDAAVLGLAQHYGARGIHDTTSDLNAALDLGKTAAIAAGAEALLVIPGDMPLITVTDVEGLLGALQRTIPVSLRQQHDEITRAPLCVIAPDQEGNGTNALGFTLPTRMHFLFGEHSFNRHLEQARSLGINVRVYASSTLALDIDTPDDLARSEQIKSGERSFSYGSHWLCSRP
jgi:2-phospho-L-lactate guanylyltransferase